MKNIKIVKYIYEIYNSKILCKIYQNFIYIYFSIYLI